MTKKILNPTINVSPKDFIELCWTSARYGIGRRTGVSLNAEMMWRYIRDNRDKLNQDRLLFFARDIRAYISDVVHWYRNCHVDNDSNDRINVDAYSLLVNYLEAHPEVDFKTNKFYIDCVSGEVSHEPRKEKPDEYRSFPDCDLSEWIKLANCIDRLLEVELSDGDKSETKICVEAPTHKYDSDGKFMGTDEMKLCNADNWRLWVPEEYIKSVKRINNDKTE